MECNGQRYRTDLFLLQRAGLMYQLCDGRRYQPELIHAAVDPAGKL